MSVDPSSMNLWTSFREESKLTAVSSKNLEVIKTLASQSLTMYSTSSGWSLQLIAVYLSPIRQAANTIGKNKK